jgi:hypothetical protein
MRQPASVSPLVSSCRHTPAKTLPRSLGVTANAQAHNDLGVRTRGLDRSGEEALANMSSMVDWHSGSR